MRIQTLIVAACLLTAWCARGNAAAEIWIDTDLSLGSPLREADDGYALLLALHSPTVRIAGVSATFGNAPAASTFSRTRNFIRRFGDASHLNAHAVFLGAERAGDTSTTPATIALRRALARNHDLTYIALGPLTNLATFVRRYPREARRLKQIVLVAGKTPGATLGFGPRERFRVHDANYIKDRAAIRTVLHTGIPIILAPIESAPLVTKRDRQEMLRAGLAARFVARKSATWMRFWNYWVGESGAPIFDALAVFAVANPALVITQVRYVEAGDDLIAYRAPAAGRRSVRFCKGLSRRANAILRDRLVRNPSDRTAKSAPRSRH
ncbi:MAG: nucleoside hydrolase [Verrucomicrobiota bacterium]|nr:nucleoside hydrolase [Verrucomicrobiota bacterium]